MHIIAVDDERLALEVLQDAIEKAVPEARVRGFRDPAEAEAYVRSNGCDVAFLDIKMRGVTGLELAKRFKDIRGEMNIVFVTGYSEYLLDAFRLYASDYILKPATPEAVARAMEHLRCPIRPKQEKHIRFQCFGNFEVFADAPTLANFCFQTARPATFCLQAHQDKGASGLSGGSHGRRSYHG